MDAVDKMKLIPICLVVFKDMVGIIIDKGGQNKDATPLACCR